MWHPHIPLFSPQKFWDLYPDSNVKLPEAPADDLADVPAAGQKMAAARRVELERIIKEGKHREFVRAYLAAISFADALVGRVLDSLERSEHARNTVIVFWSDNGWHLGEKQHVHKSTLWQRSTHVPMIFAGPGLKSPGVARRQPVNLLDLYPTLAEMCGRVVARRVPHREVQLDLLKFMSLGFRADRVIPRFKDDTSSYTAISPRIFFRTAWSTREFILVNYSHFFLGDHAFPGSPYSDYPVADSEFISVTAQFSF
jgi:arylsulfatase A-like enzyme